MQGTSDANALPPGDELAQVESALAKMQGTSDANALPPGDEQAAFEAAESASNSNALPPIDELQQALAAFESASNSNALPPIDELQQALAAFEAAEAASNSNALPPIDELQQALAAMEEDYILNELRNELNCYLNPGIKINWNTWKEEYHKKEHGWLKATIKRWDKTFWGRWEYRDKVESNISKYIRTPIPQIKFTKTDYCNTVYSYLVQMLDSMPNEGQWDETNQGWLYFEYFCDWFLWAFGHPSYKNQPIEPIGCENARYLLGASAEYIVAAMIANPFDYLGQILYDSRLISDDHFFNLPSHESVEIGVNEFSDADQNKAIRFPIPILDSGRQMLHLSNYCLNICGQSAHPTLLKICQVQSYLYAPWVAEPIKSIADNHQDFFWKSSIAGYMLTYFNIYQFSVQYKLDGIRFEPDYDSKDDWCKYSPFCLVREKLFFLLDPLILNTSMLCKK